MAHRLETPAGGGARRLGPADQGAAVRLAEFEAADFEPGFRYDLVEGRLQVSPEPNLSHDLPLQALANLLFAWCRRRGSSQAYVSARARVFPPGTESTTGPDLAVLLGDPHAGPEDKHWRDLQPLLLVEALSPGDTHKHLVRNRDLYARLPTLREYWILDPRRGRAVTTLLVLSRDPGGAGWREQHVAAGGRHESSLFDGLVVDLSQADLGLAALEQAVQEELREAARLEGARSLLAGQLEERFGRLPAQVRELLDAAQAPELERWSRRLLRADRLEDVFGD